jgi:hypothetical protein
MGAALTYARRYALFTLVGIAGEDDLDAPDLATPAPHSSGLGFGESGHTNGSGGPVSSMRSVRRNGKAPPGLQTPTLSAAESETIREGLLTEVAALDSNQTAAMWAQRTLPVKNTLTAGDAELVEEAFRSRMTALELPTGEGGPAAAIAEVNSVDIAAVSRTNDVRRSVPEPVRIDKSALSISEPRRMRDKAHRNFVSKQPCLVCGRQPADSRLRVYNGNKCRTSLVSCKMSS